MELAGQQKTLFQENCGYIATNRQPWRSVLQVARAAWLPAIPRIVWGFKGLAQSEDLPTASSTLPAFFLAQWASKTSPPRF